MRRHPESMNRAAAASKVLTVFRIFSINIHADIVPVFVRSRGVKISLSPLFVSLSKHLLFWADVLICELNYRFLISSPLEASGPSVNSMDILSQTGE